MLFTVAALLGMYELAHPLTSLESVLMDSTKLLQMPDCYEFVKLLRMALKPGP